MLIPIFLSFVISFNIFFNPSSLYNSLLELINKYSRGYVSKDSILLLINVFTLFLENDLITPSFKLYIIGLCPFFLVFKYIIILLSSLIYIDESLF